MAVSYDRQRRDKPNLQCGFVVWPLGQSRQGCPR